MRLITVLVCLCTGCWPADPQRGPPDLGPDCSVGETVDEAGKMCLLAPDYDIILSQGPSQHWAVSGGLELQFAISAGFMQWPPPGPGPFPSPHGTGKYSNATFTWSLVNDAAAASIDMMSSGGVGITRLTNIVPDGAPAAATQFTCDVVSSGGTQTNAFSLVTGSL